jgi:hypothetical protein
VQYHHQKSDYLDRLLAMLERYQKAVEGVEGVDLEVAVPGRY